MRKQSFFYAVRQILPLMVGVAPFALIWGVATAKAGIPTGPAMILSLGIFAGTAQMLVLQMMQAGAAAWMIVISVFIINLRHMIYSASMAPYVKELPLRWKFPLGYLLTDECYAVTIAHYECHPEDPYKHWYFLGAGLTLWTTWQLSVFAGLTLGAQIPADIPLDIMAPLTFLALLIPLVRDWKTVLALIIGGAVSVWANPLPNKLGLVLAILAGMAGGLLAETLTAGKEGGRNAG